MKLKGFKADADKIDNTEFKAMKKPESSPIVELDAGDYKRLACYILDAVESMDDAYCKHTTLKEGQAVREKIVNNYTRLSAQQKNDIFKFNRILTSYANVTTKGKFDVSDRNIVEMLIIYETLYLVNDINTLTKRCAPGYIDLAEFKKREKDIILLNGYLNALKKWGPVVSSSSIADIVNRIINNPKKFIRTCWFTLDPDNDSYRKGFNNVLLEAGIASICVDLRSVLTDPANISCTFYVNDDTVYEYNKAEQPKPKAKVVKFIKLDPAKELKQPPMFTVVNCGGDLGDVLDFLVPENLIQFIRKWNGLR